MYYRQLAVDDAGPLRASELQAAEPLFDDTVKLTLIDETEDYRGALKAHRALEAMLRELDAQESARRAAR